jgi:peptidoglycan/LPS O-acetylase OafA/YrhL
MQVKRLLELDALRGVAALSVVLLHFHDMWLNSDIARLSLRQVRLLTALTPIYAGNEAVILFFLLSGMVLAMPFEGGKWQSYKTFIIRRVTRIYGPYLAAILLAVAASTIWHGNLHHGRWPSDMWTGSPNLRVILNHIGFIGVYDCGKLNVSIWSLIHEMRISLVFPALWLLTRKLGLIVSLLMAGAGSTTALLLTRCPPDSAVWSLGLTVHYAGFFIVGILLARHLDLLRRRLAGRWALLLLGAISLFFYFGGMGLLLDRFLGRHFQPRVATIYGNWVVLLGAVGLVLLTVGSEPTSAFFRSRVPLFLGRISYSLYLIHVVVLMALTFVAGALSPWIQFPIYLTLSLLLSTLFCLFVEEPFMRWGRTLTSDSAARSKQ